MFGGDEIIFSGKYKDMHFGMRFPLDGKEAADIAHILAHISMNAEPFAYRFSGIDTEGISRFITLKGKGIPAVADWLEGNSSSWTGWIKENLAKSEPKLLPAAESYLFNQLLDKAGVAFRVSPEITAKAEREELEGQIAFIGRYKDWIAIKKLGLDGAKDYEVSGILSGINHTVINKSFDFAGMADDEAVRGIAKGKRKSYGNVLLALRGLEEVPDPSPYVVCKVLEESGFRPYASPGMLTEAYPDIKPPKVRGRKPKG